jgi:hypothetical protein
MCDMMSRYWRLGYTGLFTTSQEPLVKHNHGVSWRRYVNAKKNSPASDLEMDIRRGAAVAELFFIQLILSLSLTTRSINPPRQPPISISLPDPISISLPNPINQNDEVRCSSSILPRPPYPRSTCGSSTPSPSPHVTKDHQSLGEVDWRECLRRFGNRYWM